MPAETLQTDAPAAGRGRIVFFDALRGCAVISMVLFHTAYDLAYLYGFPLPWFTGTAFQTVWRCSISWTFLFLAGWMTSFSRNNLKRAAVYAAAALVVFAVTTVASVDTAVNFGILYCMAVSTLLCTLLQPALDRCPPVVALACCLACFCLSYSVPLTRYPFSGLAWLGLPSTGFSSGDYYPLLPYCFLYLAGAAAARLYQEKKGGSYPSWMQRDPCPPLAWIGQHSLLIYLLHQPCVLAVLELLSWAGAI